MGCENYSQLVSNYKRLMGEMTAGISNGSTSHCPESADAVNDYLRDGEVTPITADALTEFQMPRGIRYRRRSFQQISQGIRNCNHRVIRAVRNAEQMADNNLTQHHYFVLFRYRSDLYVADAYGAPHLSTNVREYLQQVVYTSLEVASRNYDVTPVDPLDGLGL